MRSFVLLGALALVAGCNSAEEASPAAGESKAEPVPVATAPLPLADVEAPPLAQMDAAPAVDLPAPAPASAPEAKAKAKKPRTTSKEEEGADPAILAAPENPPIVGALMANPPSSGRLRPADMEQGSGLDVAIAHVKGTKPGARQTDRTDGAPPNLPKEEQSLSSIKIGGITNVGDSSLSTDHAAKRLRARYLGTMKRCYVRLLKTNPKAAGRVNFTITVSASGRVAKSAVQGFDPTVDKCLKAAALRWRFAAPKDDSGQPMSASFKYSATFKPNS